MHNCDKCLFYFEDISAIRKVRGKNTSETRSSIVLTASKVKKKKKEYKRGFPKYPSKGCRAKKALFGIR